MNGSGSRGFDPSRLTKAAAAELSSSASESEDDFAAPGGGLDDGEFGDLNPRKRRRLGGNNKEKAALGIFGSDSEEDGPNRRWKSKTLRNKGMSFVAKASESDGENHRMDEEDQMMIEDEHQKDDRPALGNGKVEMGEETEEEEDDDHGMGLGLGLGFGGPPESTGWAMSDQAAEAPEPPPSLAPSTKFSRKTGVLGQGFVPSSANDPVLREADRNGAATPQNKAQPSAFDGKGKINPKSFGARMMAKMGYVEGQGLGTEGQGRNVIIEANLRPQGIGLGAVKEKSDKERQEEKRQARLRGETNMDSDEEEKKQRRKKNNKTLGGAFDSASSTPRRHKTKYLTAEELRAAAPGLHIPEAFAPILDMTAPGSRMLTSTSGIMTPTSGDSESTEGTEARKLVKRAQADLFSFSEEWKALEARKTWTSLALREKEQQVEDLQSDVNRLRAFSNLVTTELPSATEWRQAIDVIQKAVELNTATAGMAEIIVASIHPFIRDSDWDPVGDPGRFAFDLRSLSRILLQSTSGKKAVGKWDSSAVRSDDVYRRHHKATTSYESLMYKIWLPRVLGCVRAWDPFDPSPMLAILESWNDLLPSFVRAQFMNNVARKLETAVSEWNPRKKRQSHHLPHTWLFPWLQYLPHYHLDPKGTGLVADVRRKFRQLIDVWEFERGLVPGLTQWQEILGDQWRNLIMAHVLPSMGRYVRANFRVDPADQEPYLPILTGIFKWEPVLGAPVVAQLLVQDMFPMWNTKLQEWLALDEADLAEVAEWYTWWRGIVLKDMAAIEVVSSELDKGLQAMNLV